MAHSGHMAQSTPPQKRSDVSGAAAPSIPTNPADPASWRSIDHRVRTAVLEHQRNVLAGRLDQLNARLESMEETISRKDERIEEQQAQQDALIDQYERVIAEKDRANRRLRSR